jgi:hypothetical protein
VVRYFVGAWPRCCQPDSVLFYCLAELKNSLPGQIAIDYKDVEGGGQLTFMTADASLVAALHQWFDAQLSDHGADAIEGHVNHGTASKP